MQRPVKRTAALNRSSEIHGYDDRCGGSALSSLFVLIRHEICVRDAVLDSGVDKRGRRRKVGVLVCYTVGRKVCERIDIRQDGR